MGQIEGSLTRGESDTRIRVWGAVRDHCFRKVTGRGFPLESQDLTSRSYVAKFTGLGMNYLVLSEP